ncbi:hypothetical protein QTP81_12245 [Alteromonas sp. ASW11-36]|uniref:DUF1579 domain-containing protein n=1 Tax=Alteromonas arenosi TaxID=3055817 RepID=A0ABT7SYV4_9ALTE|nr:hypothetical protein [Alteromonas sp. ASW11-36]MDM7861367.1 hypothetical protein [Alteromonas sp. ASW11-36]
MAFSRRLIAVVLMLGTTPLLSAQNPAPCTEAEYRQFDFWLGQWQVTQADGTVAGTNSIVSAYQGCVVTEHYEVAGQPYGMSINAYDRATQQWHQTWMDRNGTVLKLSGGIQNGIMVLSAKVMDSSGKPATHQISWEPQADGTVVQHWQYKLDDSEQWSTLFKGIYTKQSS